MRIVTTAFDPATVIDEVTDQLAKRFPDRPSAEVRRIVTEEVTELEHRPVKDYVAVLSARAAKKRLLKG